jgi:N,N-dimethylformamidase
MNNTTITQNVFGYTDRFSARPGESIDFHISCEGTDSYEMSLVRLRHGFDGSAGPGFLETEVPSDSNGTYSGAYYTCQPGSFVDIEDPQQLLADPAGLQIQVAVFATLPRNDRTGTLGAYRVSHSTAAFTAQHQTVAGTWDNETQRGWALLLENGVPTFVWCEDGHRRSVEVASELTSDQWYEVTVAVPVGPGSITLDVAPLYARNDLVAPAANTATAEHATTQTDGDLTPATTPFRIGALSRTEGDRLLADSPFNGKIARLRIDRTTGDSAVENVAAWHFGRSTRPDRLLLSDVIDESANALHGRCVNSPVRGVTGPSFLGLSDDFRDFPDQFDAIHFHDDAITDADWPKGFTVDLPADLSSGVYAARLTADGITQHVPFFVGPGQRQNGVAVLFPTATYLAYANDRIAFEADSIEALLGHIPVVHSEDLVLQDHPEFGRSCYEIHNDGSGVVFGGVHRPLITMQPRYRAPFGIESPWALPSDLAITHWLETLDCAFDAITDEELDLHGSELLRNYRVVITGSHPEYVTSREIDALHEFTADGGRLMYLGGNGFFATTSFDPEQRHIVEIRRADGGTRPHQSPYAERRHTTSGEEAGLWRNKGRAPQRLVGVGMSAQGFDRSTHYQRLIDSMDPRATFIFEGIAENEKIGDFGIMGGGAAGGEIDCYQPSLGAPADTLLLATSGPLSDVYVLVAEETYETLPGMGATEQPLVRADLVYCALNGGGGFFSTGSIAWTASLSHNDYQNNVATLTSNVLKRFRDAEPLK